MLTQNTKIPKSNHLYKISLFPALSAYSTCPGCAHRYEDEKDPLKQPFLEFLKRLRRQEPSVVAVVKHIQSFVMRLQKETRAARLQIELQPPLLATLLRNNNDANTITPASSAFEYVMRIDMFMFRGLLLYTAVAIFHL